MGLFSAIGIGAAEESGGIARSLAPAAGDATAWWRQGARTATTFAGVGAGVGLAGWLGGMGLSGLGAGIGGAIDNTFAGLGDAAKKSVPILLVGGAVLGAIILFRRHA
ncbi:MAG: hypothetical protein ABR586_01330 [Thermoplasmatota archaeon]